MTALWDAEEVTIYFRCAAIGFATRKNHDVIAAHESGGGQCHRHEGAVFGGARRWAEQGAAFDGLQLDLITGVFAAVQFYQQL